MIASLVAFILIASYLAKRYPGSDVLANMDWPVILGVTIAAVAITGGFYSPLWAFLVLPIIDAVARFRGAASALAVLLTLTGSAFLALNTPTLGNDRAILAVFTLAFIGIPLWLLGEYIVRLREQAALDPLTELFNRHQLDGQLAEFDVTFERVGGSMALIISDIDYFKQINDEYGHSRGDEVLRGVAYILRNNIRMDDIAFRAGGDEFVIVLPGTGLSLARGVGERVRKAIEQGRPGDLHVTVSCGIAVTNAGDGVDMNSLMRVADKAMYESKQGGRNRVMEVSSDALVEDEPGLRVA